MIVGADDWPSALRSARKTLGEEGGVPAGASVVMSSSGEVTILDSAQRLRYVLTRTEETAAAPLLSAHAPEGALLSAHAPEGALRPAQPRRAVTVAYSPEDAAQARRQLAAATQVQPPVAAAPPARSSRPPISPIGASPMVAAPGFAPSRPSSRPAAIPQEAAAASEPPAPMTIPAKRPAAMAYAAEESGRLRKALDQARPTPTPATPVASSEIVVAPAPVGPPNAPVALPAPRAAQPPPAPPAPADTAPVAPSRPNRRQTMPYSPEESAAARAQLAAAQAGARPPLRADALPNVQSMLVTLGYRDEEQGPGSQLTYRERSYYWPPPVVQSDVERALHGELGSMQRNLEGRPRGQYVNLAVFDHAFGERPERPPVATLQWKDWRGEPVFSWSGESQVSQWAAAPAEQAMRTSLPPQQSGREVAGGSPSQPTLAPVVPAPPSPAVVPRAPAAWPQTAQPSPAVAWRDPTAPAVPPPVVAPARPAAPAPPFTAPAAPFLAPAAQPAPRSALLTPVPTARQGNRDVTGDQDKRLAIAFEATQDLYFLATPADGLDFGVKLLQELVPSEAISGCIYDINTDEFRFVAVTGVGAAERRAAAVRSSSGLFAAAVRSGRDDLIIPDVANEPRYEPDCDGRTGLVAQNMAFLPLHKADQLFGMLQLINRQGPRGFTESDVSVANYVANQVTEFLRSKRGLGRR